MADTAAAADTLSSKLSTKLYFAKVFFMVLNICFAAFLVFLLAALTRGLPLLGFVVNPVQMSPLRTHRRHAGNDLSHLVRTVLHSSQLNGNFLTSSRARFICCIGVWFVRFKTGRLKSCIGVAVVCSQYTAPFKIKMGINKCEPQHHNTWTKINAEI